MPMFHEPPAKRRTLNLRIKAEERDLIDRAAHATGKSRTESILDATRRTAEETLSERRMLADVPRTLAWPEPAEGRMRPGD